VPSPSSLQHNQKEKEGNLREGAYLQAPALAYQFWVPRQALPSFDDGGSCFKRF